uniref:HTH CENPB-type domain-containing protein n=1 Tax=Anopheles farauti TaxID=69004 RepID=A0A182QDM1_9DIPT
MVDGNRLCRQNLHDSRSNPSEHEILLLDSQRTTVRTLSCKAMEPQQSAGKRKKIVLTLEQKLTLIRRYEKGETAQGLSKEYHIGLQTVRDIIKQKEKILMFIQNCDTYDGPTKRKSMKMSTYEELDASMLSWYNETRATGVPITSSMCIEQAKNLYEAIGFTGAFNASAGWLNRFKQRYGIVNDYTTTSLKTGCAKAADKFSCEFRELMKVENWLPDQIYNADETGVYWNAMPHRSTGSSTTQYQKSYERITVLCCANASGAHKMRLAVVGKPKNDQSAELRSEYLPLDYYDAKGSWMTKEIFQNWFDTKWVPEVREFLAEKGLPQRAVLLLDTAPFHPDEISLQTDDGGMIAKFIPQDAANLMQPMQQGITSQMKWNYRTDLLKTDSVSATNRTLVDALHELAHSWANVTTANITSAWNKLVPKLEQYVVEYVEDKNAIDRYDSATTDDGGEGHAIGEQVIEEVIEQVDMVEWLDVNDDVTEDGFKVEEGELLEEEFIEKQADDSCEEEDEVEDQRVGDKRIQLHTALTSVEALLEFVDPRGLTQHDRTMLKKIQADVRKLRKSCKSEDV